MACGYIAMNNAGIAIDNYYAYEIDSNAIRTAKHNFPDINELGDVFNADFSVYNGCDFLIGGSPCTYWSKGQRNERREIDTSGIGYGLFAQYARALKEAAPTVFIYENNISISDTIIDGISDELGVEPICINSSLVSAQDRKRLYWVGIKDYDGSYKSANVKPPENRHIYVRDILDTHDNSSNRPRFRVDTRDKPFKVFVLPRHDGVQTNGQAFRVYSQDAKAPCLKATRGGAGAKTGLYAIEARNGQHNTYVVRNGTIKMYGKTYPINLADGSYCIRKLNIDECKRLQTVPDWYKFSYVSETQAYKMLGNGWTCDVITHIIRSCVKDVGW